MRQFALPMPSASSTAHRLDGCKVGLLAGIARPDSLRRTLGALGAQVVSERVFPDHHRYRPRDLVGLAKEAALWITTEKDALKIHPSWTGVAQVLVLVIDLDVEEPEGFLDWLSGRLR
jgi:tetraacyldisaccharide 4'-kinase